MLFRCTELHSGFRRKKESDKYTYPHTLTDQIHTHRQTDREIERHSEREREREREREMLQIRYTHTDRQTER